MSEYVIWIEDKRADVVDTDKIYKVSRPAHLQEPIVRCRDCKHYIAPGAIHFDDGTTNLDACSIVRTYMVKITPDGFCAWGARKEGGE